MVAGDLELGLDTAPLVESKTDDDNAKLGPKNGLITVPHFPWNLGLFFRPSPLCHLSIFVVFVVRILKFEQRIPEDLSVCGFNMINPYIFNFMFAMLCFSGGELSVRMIYMLTENTEMTPTWLLAKLLQLVAPVVPKAVADAVKMGLKTLLRTVSVLVALSMCSFVAIPRCLFNPHQHMVECFMMGGCVEMALVAVLYSNITRMMLFPYVFFCSFCVYNYNVGGPYFFFGELGFISTYISFCTVALHPRLVRPEDFSAVWWAISCALPAWLLTEATRFSIYLCKHPRSGILL